MNDKKYKVRVTSIRNIYREKLPFIKSRLDNPDEVEEKDEYRIEEYINRNDEDYEELISVYYRIEKTKKDN